MLFIIVHLDLDVSQLRHAHDVHDPQDRSRGVRDPQWPIAIEGNCCEFQECMEAIAVDERHVCEIDRDRSPARPQRLQQFCKLGAIGHVDLTSDAYHRTVGGFIVVA